MTVVLDASYALDWLTAATGDAASRVLPGLAEQGLLAPVTFWHEAASGLRYMALRGAIPDAYRTKGIQRLRELSLTLDAATAPIEAVMRVSDRHQLTVYDAAYLELALRTSSTLATRDKGLASAARAARVSLVQPA